MKLCKPENWSQKKRKIFFLTFFLLHCYLISSAQISQITNQNMIFIYLEGYDETFEFYSGNLESNFDKKKSKFEFKLPVRSIQPRDSLLEDDLINYVFQPGLYPDILLTFTYNNNIINLKEIRTPEKITVDALLTLKNQIFETPLSLTLFSDGETLFYRFNFEINIKEMFQNFSEGNNGIFNGNISFLVQDGEWNDFFSQYQH